MNHALITPRIDRMRSAARSIVRELGFMQKGLAGTELSPSAVHTIIELGYGTVENAGDLGRLLHLEKSSISRLVQKLENEGLIEGGPHPSDKRSRILSLTPNGRNLLGDVEKYARRQLRSALDVLPADDVSQIETGLILFAKSLRAKPEHASGVVSGVELHQGYRSGVIASVAYLHASFYSQYYWFGSVFERKVATEMSEFMGRIDNPMNTTFSAYLGDELLGSVSLDGEDLGEGTGHLRWFIVSKEAQGMGIGNLLISKVTAFVDQYAFDRTRLWTFKGLDAARHLYEKHGFMLTDEATGTQWGTEVVEQEFVRQHGG
ncbi:helix-turn-helix domain-containing GNAT family N-acetyltransferase [Ruegeria meonggei]|uniref:Acetyltransferase (GNAT) family protein n=1 Tax=Ruegeria meonggei TaxID=1446476 RepID=A0A1X6Z417_9RHOB|nr:helix-turn-helix domain-containing GNAT family N-acetyltransferase [Ruegeria meonggei]SLN39884.1 Acetyltransferase (GNAT) family protein [Ruegeria meonggei]